jgi:tRNA pseudouridine55 synthase
MTNPQTQAPEDKGQVLLIDKPKGWSSFDAVKKVRNLLRIKKIGHAGTLDPLATGLLIMCTGKMTKQIDTYQGQPKEYTGEILLGKTTPSIDLETEFDAEFDISHITEELIRSTTSAFIGPISQIPPIYSAVRQDGERLYKKARRGEETEIKPREVTIYEFEITAINMPYVEFRVVCSKGTYIRSLARDFGVALQSGACLTALRRTKIGDFDVSNAKQISDLVAEFKPVTE